MPIKIKSRNCINEVFQCPENYHYSNAGKNLCYFKTHQHCEKNMIIEEVRLNSANQAGY